MIRRTEQVPLTEHAPLALRLSATSWTSSTSHLSVLVVLMNVDGEPEMTSQFDNCARLLQPELAGAGPNVTRPRRLIVRAPCHEQR